MIIVRNTNSNCKFQKQINRNVSQKLHFLQFGNENIYTQTNEHKRRSKNHYFFLKKDFVALFHYAEAIKSKYFICCVHTAHVIAFTSRKRRVKLNS